MEYRVTIMGQHQGQAHQNVLHFEKSGAVTADQNVLAADIRDNWCAIWHNGMPANFQYQNIHVKSLSGVDVPIDLAVAINGVGGADSGTLPFSAFNIRLQTATAGKHGRGRYYQGGVNPGHAAFGVLTPGNVTFFQNICNLLMARYGPSGASSFRLGVRGRASGATFYFVETMTVDSIVRVQRRRNIGVGI